MRLAAGVYVMSAVDLAPLLLGKTLCRRIGEEVIRRRIIETEAYAGESDTACHAHKGKTPRTSVMYELGGIAYIYLCYGIHNLLNVVAGNVGEPEAVLIRGLEGITGPGRLTKALHIDRSLNRENFITGDAIWLEEGDSFSFTVTPRIGIGYASEKDQRRLWRFVADL